MSQNPPSEDAARWKAKFLDALEDQERRENAFRSRINLLRRGLVGVSLAGDGLDTELDKALNQLRVALRAEDSEAGLDPLFEQIERSVLRLDTDRNQGSEAIRKAIEGSLVQLEATPVSRQLRRELRQFGRHVPDLVKDRHGLPRLTIEFLALLRKVVREIALIPEVPVETGFWRRLFFGGAPPVQESGAIAEAPASVASTPACDTRNRDLQTGVPTTPPASADPAQPGFSFIASHVEPLLLRILENIHVTAGSQGVAHRVRAAIEAGLNWYDFAAVLEDIAAIIASAIEQERTDFQGFLTEINASLEHVQAYVVASREHSDRSRAADTALDRALRAEVESLHQSVNTAGHVDELKQTVQAQLAAIVSAVDSFGQERRRQDAQLHEQTQQLTERIASLERESHELQTHLAQQVEKAARDGLTELPNRGAYDQTLRQLLTLPQPSARPFCLVVADVDLFKTVNDTFGHLAGDKVLKILAREIGNGIRRSDFVARYGGEEFTIIMQEADQATAVQVMEKIRLAVSQIPFHFKETQVQITMSFGIAEACPDDTAETLFEKADRALYAAKHSGRNRCQVFSSPVRAMDFAP